MDARLIQRRYLVLHQRNQRGNHQRNPVHQQRRHLKTDRFTRSRGHDAERIPAFQNAVDQALLPFTEAVISEILL